MYLSNPQYNLTDSYQNKPFESTQEYQSFRVYYDELKSAQPAIKLVMEKVAGRHPLYLKYSAKQIFNVCRILLSLIELMEKKLEGYNKTNYVLPQGVHHITENELWQSRAKSYDYWM